MGNQVSHSDIMVPLARKQPTGGSAYIDSTAVITLAKDSIRTVVPLRDGLGLALRASKEHSGLTQPDDNRLAAAGFPGAVMQAGRILISAGQVVWELQISGLLDAQQDMLAPSDSNITSLASPAFQLPAHCTHPHPHGSMLSQPPHGCTSGINGEPAEDVLVTSSMKQLSVSDLKVAGSDQHLGGSSQDRWRFMWRLARGTDRHVSLHLIPPSQPLPSTQITAASYVLVQALRDGHVQLQHKGHVPEMACPGADAEAVAKPRRLLNVLDACDLLNSCDKLRVTWTIPVSQDGRMPDTSATTHSTVAARGASVVSQPSDATTTTTTTAAGNPMQFTTVPHWAAPAAAPLGPSLPLQVVIASLSPRILLVENFLDQQLCEELVQLAAPRLVRSRVSTGTETPSRTSRGTFLTGAAAQHPLVQQVEQRMMALVQHVGVSSGKKPLIPSEALQVVAYGPGDFYTEHYDNKAGGHVTRHATILVYLNDCEQGGGTYFSRATAPPTEHELDPSCSTARVAQLTQELHNDKHVPRPGVRVLPVQGRAILFWSALPDGSEDLTSLHAAETVHKGQKWIATRWYKEPADPADV